MAEIIKNLKTLTLPNSQGEPVKYKLCPEWDNIEGKPESFGVGEFYEVNGTVMGEIFNDYENNKASAEFAHVEGSNNTTNVTNAHIEGFKSGGIIKAFQPQSVELIVATNIDSVFTNNGTITVSYDTSSSAAAATFTYNGVNYSIANVGNKAEVRKTLGLTADQSIYLILGLNSIEDIAEGMTYNLCYPVGTKVRYGKIIKIDGNTIIIDGEVEGIHRYFTIYNALPITTTDFHGNIIINGGTIGNIVITNANGMTTHSEGIETYASINGHSEGYQSKALAFASHAEGRGTLASGDAAHAEGAATKASGHQSHAEGEVTESSGYAAHAEGNRTKASGSSAHAEGSSTIASGISAHSEGTVTEASGNYSHAEGNRTKASGQAASASGGSTEASGDFSEASGYNSKSTGNSSHAEGRETTASNTGTHAEGRQTVASGLYAHAEGYSTEASGDISHAEGNGTIASGENSHAEGANTEAKGTYSHAEGFATQALADYTHVEGRGTIARGRDSHVEGKYNIKDIEHKYAHIIGNGTSDTERSNAHTVDWEGNAWYAGDVYVGGSDQSTGERLARISDLNMANAIWIGDSGMASVSEIGKIVESINSLYEPGLYYFNGDQYFYPDGIPYPNGFMTLVGFLKVEKFGSSFIQTLYEVDFANASAPVYKLIRQGWSYSSSSGYSEWEWENPPMTQEYEFRTTERLWEKPVYKKLFYYGVLPNATQSYASHGIQNLEQVKRITLLPLGYGVDAEHLASVTNVYVDAQKIYITTNTNLSTENCFVLIEYTRL